MIVEINNNFIETDEIVNVTPIYDVPGEEGMYECFKVNLPNSYVLIKGDGLKEKRDRLIEVWTDGKIEKI
jgi:hypothetical protein